MYGSGFRCDGFRVRVSKPACAAGGGPPPTAPASASRGSRTCPRSPAAAPLVNGLGFRALNFGAGILGVGVQGVGSRV